MGDADFQTRMLEGMAELRTDMKRLVGSDGNGGVISSHESRLKSLEDAQSRARGFAAAAGLLGSIIGAGLDFLLHKR